MKTHPTISRSFTRILGGAFLLILSVFMTIAAGASDVSITNLRDGFTAGLRQDNSEIIRLEYQGKALASGEQYVVMMIAGDAENYAVEADTILYIDQKAAEVTNSGSSIAFDIYPSAMQKAVLCLFGVIDGEPKASVVAQVIPESLKGDINIDESVDINDAILMYNHITNPTQYPIEYTGSLNFDGDAENKVDINDIIYLFGHSILPRLYSVNDK